MLPKPFTGLLLPAGAAAPRPPRPGTPRSPPAPPDASAHAAAAVVLGADAEPLDAGHVPPQRLQRRSRGWRRPPASHDGSGCRSGRCVSSPLAQRRRPRLREHGAERRLAAHHLVDDALPAGRRRRSVPRAPARLRPRARVGGALGRRRRAAAPRARPARGAAASRAGRAAGAGVSAAGQEALLAARRRAATRRACWRSRELASSTRCSTSSSALRHRPARGAHGGDLELDARMRRLAHGRVGVEERAQRRRGARRALTALAERAQLVAFGVGDVGQLGGRRRLQHERPAQQLDDVAGEAPGGPRPRAAARSIASSAGAVSWREQRRAKARTSAGAVAPSRRRGRLGLEPAVAVGDGGVEQRQRVAQRALGRAHDRRQRRRARRRLFSSVEDALERRRPARRARSGRKSKRCTRERTVAGMSRGSVVARMKTTCGGGSSSVLRSALKACRGELVDLVDDVDLVAPARGRVLDVLAQRPDLLDAAVGGARRSR